MAGSSEILRYEIPIDDADHLVPAGPVVLVHAHRQGLARRVEVWVDVPRRDKRSQRLRVVGTGHLIPPEYQPVGSCVDGPLVWRVCTAPEEVTR